jgi:hypothetical protein
MDITKLDENFKINEAVIDGENKIYSLPCKEIDLYGTTYDEKLGWFQRMPYQIAKQITYNIEVLSSTTAGARAKFSTDAQELILSVSYKYIAKMNQMPFSGSSGFTLLEENDNKYKYIASFIPKYDNQTGYTIKAKLPGGSMHEYVLFFPMYNDYITDIKLAFPKESTVKNGRKYRFDLPVLYYGSSITQGGCCSRPDNCYHAYISKWNDVDFLNLGFSGGAKGEDIMIEYLSNVKSKVFVCDYDHNAPNAEHLKKTHYKLYKAYRDKNPDTPIIFMTSPNCDGVPMTSVEATKRRRVIKNTYLKARAEGDENVYFIDGKNLFGKNDRENCTVDGCHPNDLGFYKMAQALNKVIAPLLK